MSSRPTHRSCYSSRGITLLEVLVVIAISAVMIVALLPALSRARGAVNTVRCGANQQAIFQALMSYQQTYIMQPNLSANRREDGVYAPGDPVSGACIWGETPTATGNGTNSQVGLGQLIGTGYISLNEMFCPEFVENNEFSETPERMWSRRRFLFNVPYTAGGPAGNTFIMTYPGGDGLGLPQPQTAALYYRAHYLYRSGDWSYSSSFTATTGVANGRLAHLKSSTAGYNNKLVLMDWRWWFHERSGSGVNETWGDGSTIFKRRSNVNGGNILPSWSSSGGVSYSTNTSVNPNSALRTLLSAYGCGYFDKFEQAGR